MNLKRTFFHPARRPTERLSPAIAAHRLYAFAMAFFYLCLCASAANATNVRLGPFTNSITSQPDTNVLKVYAIGNTANADGSYSTIGLPQRFTPGPDGAYTNNFMQGNYMVTNSSLGQFIPFGGFPQDTSSTVYRMFDYQIPGTANLGFGTLNFFITRLINTNGAGGTVTFGAVTNALGGTPLQSSATNGLVTAIVTNGLATVVYVNAATNGHVTASVTNGLATIVYVNAATNGHVTIAITNTLATTNFVLAQGYVTASVTNGLSTTNYVNSATNGHVTASVTNGLATIVYVNAATNGFVTASITNGLATTNFAQSAASAATNNSYFTKSQKGFSTNATFIGSMTNFDGNVSNFIFTISSDGAGNYILSTGQGSSILSGSVQFFPRNKEVSLVSGNGQSELTVENQDALLTAGGSSLSIDGTGATLFSVQENKIQAKTDGTISILAGDGNGNTTNGLTIDNDGIISGDGDGLGFNSLHPTNIFSIGKLINYLVISTNVLNFSGTGIGNAAGTYTNISTTGWTNAIFGTQTNWGIAQLAGTEFVQSNGLSWYSFTMVAGVPSAVTTLLGAGTATVTLGAVQNNSGIYQTGPFLNPNAKAQWLADMNLATNGLVGNGVTNGLATIVYVNAATNGHVTANVTNGFATTNFVLVQSYVTASVTNGLSTTNYVNSATNGHVTASVTNGLATIVYVNAATNGNNLVFQNNNASNLIAQTSFAIGQSSIFQISTNMLVVTNSSAHGRYLFTGPVGGFSYWTNLDQPTGFMLLAVGNYYLELNNTALYINTSGNPANTNWTILSGASLPTPIAYNGWILSGDGGSVIGWFPYSTNLTALIINLIGQALIPISTNTWSQNGNNLPYGSFIGPTNNQALNVRVGNVQFLQISNVNGSMWWNGGSNNVITSQYDGGGTVTWNTILNGTNNVNGGGAKSIIGTGDNNLLESQPYEAIWSGSWNQILSSIFSQIDNGRSNTIGKFSDFSRILGGYGNAISNNVTGSLIGIAQYSIIKSGTNIFIPVGLSNSISGNNSMAFGNNITITHPNTVIFSPSGVPIASTANDQLILAFTNGVIITNRIVLNGQDLLTIMTNIAIVAESTNSLLTQMTNAAVLRNDIRNTFLASLVVTNISLTNNGQIWLPLLSTNGTSIGGAGKFLAVRSTDGQVVLSNTPPTAQSTNLTAQAVGTLTATNAIMSNTMFTLNQANSTFGQHDSVEYNNAAGERLMSAHNYNDGGSANDFPEIAYWGGTSSFFSWSFIHRGGSRKGYFTVADEVSDTLFDFEGDGGNPLLFRVNGRVQFDGNNFTSDGIGNVSVNTLNAGTSFTSDSSLIGSDGSGNLTALSFSGDGSGLMFLNGANLQSATVTSNQIFTVNPSQIFPLNGKGWTNSAATYFTNLINGATNLNVTTGTEMFDVPCIASAPATTLGRGEIDAQKQRSSDGVWITVSKCDIAEGITGVISTNTETLHVTLQSGESFRLTNNLSGAGYSAGLDSTCTNTVTWMP